MPHIHWVARQNKLELPNDEEDVNTRDIHKCDGQAHDPKETRGSTRVTVIEWRCRVYYESMKRNLLKPVYECDAKIMFIIMLTSASSPLRLGRYERPKVKTFSKRCTSNTYPRT